MKIPRSIPALLLIVFVSLILFGCNDSVGNPGASAAGATSQSSANSGASSDNTANSAATSNGSSDFKLTVVKYNFVSTDSYGLASYYIGVVRNDGNATVRQAIMHLVDDSGKVISTEDAPEVLLPQVFILPPGQSIGFSMMYAGSAIKRPQFSFEQEPDDTDLPSVNLTIGSSQLGVASDGNPDVEGDITNNSDTSANLWAVNAVGYDDSGNVVAVGSGAAADPAQALKGHATIKFRVTLSPRSGKIAKYDLFASGITTGLH